MGRAVSGIPAGLQALVDERGRNRATFLESRKALETHMPEMLPLYEELCDLAGQGTGHGAQVRL